jgi:hypothetical protein
VVCFDESPIQLIGEVRQPVPAEPGQLERYDYEYRRSGTVNLFVFLGAHRPWRKIKVTARRAAEDYAHCMRELVDVHYPDAEQIRVVQDNLSTHSAGALYQASATAVVRRASRKERSLKQNYNNHRLDHKTGRREIFSRVDRRHL